MAEKKHPDKHHGKKPKQRMKPYIVLQYLLRETDEDNYASGKMIEAFLQENCQIYAERRSIYKDIEEINEVNWMLENDSDIDEAAKVIANDKYDEEKLILYKHPKGFYIPERHFSLQDIRLMTECINSAKFVSESEAQRLIDAACEFLSVHQAKKIKADAFVIDRPKTTNTALIYNIQTIYEAMSVSYDGEPHEPEKISFHYMKNSINDLHNQVAQRKGEKYIVSPYKLVINDGNYYLLGFDDKYKEIRIYRVDRMKDVCFTSEPREGEEEYEKTNIESLIKRTFNMFKGKTEVVTLCFPNFLLDAVVERFGKKGVSYSKLDKDYFTVMTAVDISEPFYGWLAGFGKKVKVLAPDHVVEGYKAHLDKIRDMYND